MLNRVQNLHVKVSPAQKEKYVQLCILRDQSLSDLVRTLLNQACEQANIK